MTPRRKSTLVKVLDNSSRLGYDSEVGVRYSDSVVEDHQPSGARRTEDSPMQDPQGKPTPQKPTFQRLALALLAQAESELQSRAPKRRPNGQTTGSAPKAS